MSEGSLTKSRPKSFPRSTVRERPSPIIGGLYALNRQVFVLKVRFGYVAMSTVLQDCSPSKTVTVANLSKIQSETARIAKLGAIAQENLRNTQRLLFHNRGHDIAVYRLTSKLIPLATHPISSGWDWAADLREPLQSLGAFIKQENFRISAHPDHFTLLNSPREDVIEASIRDLAYHQRIFDGMGLDASAKLVLHVGGSYNDKADSLKRFKETYLALPHSLQERLVLENDDKIYTAREVLDLCQELKIPMVLDIHHHWCNNQNEDIYSCLDDIFDTWSSETIPPKIHLSSPRTSKDFRAHADYVDPEFFLEFWEEACQVNSDFDVMIEAKMKDRALFKLMQDLHDHKNIVFLNEASIEPDPAF